MSSFLPLLMFVVVGAIALGIGVHFRNLRRAAYERVAASLGLAVHTGSMFGRDQILGVLDGFDTTIDTFTRGSGKSSKTYTRIRLSGGGLPHGVSFKPEGIGSSFKKLFGNADIQVADSGFDERVLVEGDELQVVAALTASARRAISSFLSDSGRLTGGELYWETRGNVTDVGRLVSQARAMSELGRTVSLRDTTIPERLAHNAVRDTLPAVRARNMELLFTRFSGHPSSKEVAHKAVQDRDPTIRLLAAVQLGVEGLPVIRELMVAQAGHAHARVKVVHHLAAFYPDERVVPLLEMAATDLVPDVRSAAIGALAAQGHRGLLSTLLQAAPKERDEGVCVVMARAFGRLPDPRGEGALLELLEREDTRVRRAAAEALGQVGSPRAVEALLPHTKGFFTNSELKETASAAVSAIQGRIRGAGSGQLTLAEPAAHQGAISLSNAAGELSLQDPPTATKEPA